MRSVGKASYATCDDSSASCSVTHLNPIPPPRSVLFYVVSNLITVISAVIDACSPLYPGGICCLALCLCLSRHVEGLGAPGTKYNLMQMGV